MLVCSLLFIAGKAQNYSVLQLKPAYREILLRWPVFFFLFLLFIYLFLLLYDVAHFINSIRDAIHPVFLYTLFHTYSTKSSQWQEWHNSEQNQTSSTRNSRNTLSQWYWAENDRHSLCEIAHQRHILQRMVACETQETVKVQVWIWDRIPVGQFTNIILCKPVSKVANIIVCYITKPSLILLIIFHLFSDYREMYFIILKYSSLHSINLTS